MNDLTTKLAEALRLCSVLVIHGNRQGDEAINAAREALRLYEQAKSQSLTDLECPPDPDTVDRALAQPVQDLPPLPDTGLAEIHNPNTNERELSETGVAYYGSNWVEVRKLYTADQMHVNYRKGYEAGLAATPEPAPASTDLFGLSMLVAEAAWKEAVGSSRSIRSDLLKPLVLEVLAATPAPAPIIAARYRNSPEGRWNYADHDLGNIERDGWREVVYLCDVNATPAPAPKPCLVTGDCKHGNWCSEVYCQEHCRFVGAATPAPEPQPLTDEQIDELAEPFIRDLGGDHWYSGERGISEGGAQDFARAIERAHGIGQGKEDSK